MNLSDEWLVACCKNGDVKAFEALVLKYQKKAFTIALRMLGDEEDANDLAQEAFLKVFRSIKEFRGESSFSTWFFRIVANACLDELRRRRKSCQVVSLDDEQFGDLKYMERQAADPADEPEVQVERRELQRAVQAALTMLDDSNRLMIVLRDINGLSYEEIAAVLNCPVGTVKSRLNRARRALRDLIVREQFYLTRVSKAKGVCALAADPKGDDGCGLSNSKGNDVRARGRVS